MLAVMFASVLPALAQSGNRVNSHDFAACQTAQDRPVCYLKLAARSGSLTAQAETSLRINAELVGELGLKEAAVEGNARKTQAKVIAELEVKSKEPSGIFLSSIIAIEKAKAESLGLDAKGVAPKKALKPLMAATKNYKYDSRWEYSAGGKRVLVIQSFVELYLSQESSSQPRPSKPFVLEALALWERDLLFKFEQDGIVNLVDVWDLGKAYALVANRDAVRTYFKRIGLPQRAADMEYALAIKDLHTLWKLRLETLKIAAGQAAEPAEDFSGSLLDSDLQLGIEVFQDQGERSTSALAYAAKDTTLLAQIESDLNDPALLDLIEYEELQKILGYFSPHFVRPVRQRMERKWNGYLSPLIAALWVKDGRQDDVDKKIVELAATARDCPNDSDCDPYQLLHGLVLRRRLSELPNLVGDAAAKRIYEESQFMLEAEIEWGHGPLQGVSEILTNWTEDNVRGEWITSHLYACTVDRMNAAIWNPAREGADTEGALDCNRWLIRRADLLKKLSETAQKYGEIPSENFVSEMQWLAAESSIGLAANLASFDAAKSRELEEEAIRIFLDAPADYGDVSGAFVALAFARLTADGRLPK